MKSKKQFLLAIAMFAWLPCLTTAAPIYRVELDTSGYVGQAGRVYLQMTGGGDSANVDIGSFAPLSSLSANTPVTTGAVSGNLNSTLHMSDTFPVNDYTHEVVFPGTIIFDVSFPQNPLPASPLSILSIGLDGCDSTYTSCSPILSIGDPGFDFFVAKIFFYNSNGEFEALALPSGSSGGTPLPSIATITDVSVSEIPEPASCLLAGAGLVAAAFLGSRRRR